MLTFVYRSPCFLYYTPNISTLRRGDRFLASGHTNRKIQLDSNSVCQPHEVLPKCKGNNNFSALTWKKKGEEIQAKLS